MKQDAATCLISKSSVGFSTCLSVLSFCVRWLLYACCQSAVVRLQEIPSGSIYKKSSKNRVKLSLVFEHFQLCDNEWFVQDFYIQAQGGCQMCIPAVKLDHSGELFWDTPSWLSAWVSVFWARRMDLNKGVPTLFAYRENLICKSFFKSNQGTGLGWPLPGVFVGIFFLFFWGGYVGQSIYRECIVFRGSDISCSLASTQA